MQSYSNMQFSENISLKHFNTFDIDVKAKAFVVVQSEKDLHVLREADKFSSRFLLLGGGSNMLFAGDFDGLVIKMEIEGLTVMKETEAEIYIKAGAGISWHELVMYTVDHNLGGIENMSLIPGTVGAAPIQNIGAYGVELKDVFETLDAFEIETGKIITFERKACNFAYRNSFFKQEGKGKYIITAVTLKLKKTPEINISYGAIKDTLAEMNITNPDIKAISNAVIKIRQSKLPDPAEIGNAGSFFKNPEISKVLFEKVKADFPEIPSYPVDDTRVKVPAGWLIEQAGWKGKRVGNTGVHKNQALVLVNYGGAKGKEVLDLAHEIQQSVFDKFGIEIENEVNFIV